MDKGKWEEADSSWQGFYSHWRKDTTSSNLLSKFPYVLELGVDSQSRQPLLSFRPNDTSRGQILITKSYDDMFRRLSDLRLRDNGKNKGAVITGQPGTGASYDWIPTSCDNSLAHLFPRKNYLPKIHACTADLNQPGCTPVQ